MIENSMCHDITSNEFDEQLMKFTIENYKVGNITIENYKSEMKVGDITIMNTKHFNWFHKLMFKICFGIEIKDR